MNFVKVANAGDVREGQIMPIEAGGQKLFLTKSDGEHYAAQRKCPHLGVNLCRGKVEDGAVVCFAHKAAFDLQTGKVRRDPKLLFINMRAKSDLRTFPVKVEGEDVLVGI